MVVLREQSIITHAFFGVEQALKDGTTANKTLLEMWRRIREDLHLSSPVRPEWALDLRLAEVDPTTTGLRVLAAAGRSAPGVFFRATVYKMFDVVGVALVQSSAGSTWSDLCADWFAGWPGPEDGEENAAAAERREGVLGVATIHVGLTRDWTVAKPWRSPPPALTAVFDANTHPEWRKGWWRPVRELILWELAPPEGAHPLLARRLVAAAAKRHEGIVDDWLWNNQVHPSALPPFTSYLLHTAKVRYERSVLSRSLPGLNRLTKETNNQAELLAARIERGDQGSIGEVVQAHRMLARLRWTQRGLSDSLGAVQSMAMTVRIGIDNMMGSLRGAPPGPDGNPVADDLRLARWTEDQLKAEEIYLRSALDRAEAMQRHAAVEVGAALQLRKTSLVVVQTAIIGALLMALAGIQSMDYEVNWLPGYLLAPTIFTLAAVALVLPSAVLRWPRGGGGDANMAWFDIAGNAVAGTAIGWFVITLALHLAQGSESPPAWSAVAAIAGAGVGWALSFILLRKRRRRTAPGSRRLP